MAANENLGALLGDDQIVFRAFAEKSFRDRKRNKVRPGAYLLREDDVGDGLSVGLSPEAAVKYLETNEGVCQISAGVVHSLPYDLKVKIDQHDPSHAFICNLPLMTISDQQREMAMLIAGELARKSQVVTCDPYPRRS
jgi:hypothetical protein